MKRPSVQRATLVGPLTLVAARLEGVGEGELGEVNARLREMGEDVIVPARG